MKAQNDLSLWSIIERLQQQLEGKNLAHNIINAAMVQTVRHAVSGPVPEQT